MDRTLTSFIAALRNADVRISTAETLDAMSAVELCGYRNREFLKDTLALVLPKTPDEKYTFDETFDQFFAFKDVKGESVVTELDGDGEEAEGEGGAGQGQGGAVGEGTDGRKGGGKKKKFSAFEEQQDEEDLGPGEMAQPRSSLGKLLMQDSRVELTVNMAAAAKEVSLEEIQVFTQKGLYTRKIMEEMGLADLQQEISVVRQSPSSLDRRLGQELKKRR